MKQFLKFTLIALLLIPITLVTSRAQDPPDSTAVVLDSLKEVSQQVEAANDSIKEADGPIIYSAPDDGTTTIPEPVNNVTLVAIVLIALVQLRQVILNLVKNIKYLNTTVPGFLLGIGSLYAQTIANNGWQNLSWENFVISGLIGVLGSIQGDVDWKGIFAWILSLIKKRPATG